MFYERSIKGTKGVFKIADDFFKHIWIYNTVKCVATTGTMRLKRYMDTR